MRSVTVRTADLKNIIINLGFVGENEHRQIRFDAKKDFEEYPNASASLTVVPPEGENYPAIIERDGDYVLWTITDSDVIGEGDGEIQLAFTEGEVVKRTCIGRTKTDRSLVPTGSIPSGIDDFITRAGTLLEQVEETFPAGGTTGQVLAKKSNTDYDTEWIDQTGGGTGDYEELQNLPQIGGVTLKGNKSLSDLGAASASDLSAKYTKPSGGIPATDLADGVIPDPTSIIDDTAGDGDTNKVWSADKSYALLTEIAKSAKSETPNETDADLYVCDENGNVITRFKSGEIETKNFNSKYTPKALSQNVDSGSDLMIADEQGNAVMLLRDGNMRMKNFSSDNGIYEKRFDYKMAAGTETITHFFPAGTRLAFHLTDHNDRQRDGVRSNKVTYKYTDTSGTTRTLGTEYGYAFPEYVLQYDAVSVSVQYGNDLSYANTVLSFKVYAIASFPREPHILSVSASGGKDFTSIREAVEYALQTADELNRFEIQIFPGTYDILSYYTAEEIAVEGFIGLTISNGISLVGIGHRAEVILTASMDTTEYSSTQRNYVSTLNIKGNTAVRNMTIVGENIRYAVHDDMSMMAHQNNTHIFENVEFVGINMTSSDDGDISYGAGGADMKNLIFRNCDFSDALTLHTTTDLQHEYTVNFENCRARLMQFGDYDSGIPTHVYLHNCNVSRIRLGISGTHDQYMLVQGEGVSGAMIESPAGYVYALDGVHKFAGSNVSAGTAVKLTSAMDEVEASTALNTIYGISIGTLDGTTYVQTEGWINSNTLGLSGLSVGDYLTIDNTGAVVSGGTSSNSIAIVKHINSNGVAFAKLMI